MVPGLGRPRPLLSKSLQIPHSSITQPLDAVYKVYTLRVCRTLDINACVHANKFGDSELPKNTADVAAGTNRRRPEWLGHAIRKGQTKVVHVEIGGGCRE
jgi:hypothetical protein